MWLVKGAPNLMQRLSRHPPAPNVTLLDRRKPKSLSWPHANTTFTQQTYIRWCCIDLSNAPLLTVNRKVDPEPSFPALQKLNQTPETEKRLTDNSPLIDRLPLSWRIPRDTRHMGLLSGEIFFEGLLKYRPS